MKLVKRGLSNNGERIGEERKGIAGSVSCPTPLFSGGCAYVHSLTSGAGTGEATVKGKVGFRS